jgi:hypothetical protein
MEVVRTSETSVDIKLRTRQYIPEDSELNLNELLAFSNILTHNFASPNKVLLSPVGSRCCLKPGFGYAIARKLAYISCFRILFSWKRGVLSTSNFISDVEVC